MIRIPKHLQYSLELAHPAWDGWVEAVPAHLHDVVRRWSLSLGDPYEPGGHCSWVAPATDGDGRAVVLKIAFRHDEALHEAEGLAALGGRCGVEVYRYEHLAANTTAMLLERCQPGTVLHERAEAERDVVLAELLQEIWATPLPADHPFRPLAEMADAWTAQAEAVLADQPHRIDAALAREGLAAFRELSRPRGDDTLLFTDLHSQNVLASERRPWLVIDPKPYFGDRHYDVAQHLLSSERFRADPLRTLGRMADLTDLARERVRHWMFARCVQESLNPGALWDGLDKVARQLS